MEPNDANAALPTAQRPFRVLIISGSQRRQYNCPGVDPKSRMFMFRMAERLPQEWEIDLEDIGNVYARHQIQSCNACVSTSMALCTWPCNCYSKKSRMEPDLMWDLDLYARFDMADAWAIIGPVNWYAPTSNLKKMFDRMVCMNGGNPKEETIKHKDAELAMALEHTEEWKAMSVNHLEGRTAAFFTYGDDGGVELDDAGRPKILRHAEYFDPEQEPFTDMRQAYAPLVWQCRYGGVEVPDPLWTYVDSGKDQHYSDNQAEHVVKDDRVMSAFDAWTDRFAAFVAAKGKVQPGAYRAYGHTPNASWMDHIRLGIRDVRMSLGIPRRGSSPAIQQERNLNHDTTLWHKRGEGKKLRSG